MRGKDAEENEKLFVKIADIIKKAGVSHKLHWRQYGGHADIIVRDTDEDRRPSQRYVEGTICR